MTPRLTPLAFALLAPVALFTGSAQADGRAIDYAVDGEAFTGYLASAPDESRGTVLIVHDWDGLTDYERRRADMLAELGLDAFALDLYGQGNRPVETDAKKAETARLYEDRERMRRLTLAGLEEARAQGAAGPVVIMGYCFGGAVVLELARSEQAGEMAGFATFHGGLATPEGQGYPAESGPILVAHGGADAAISLDDVAALGRELEAAGTPYEIEIYSGAPHAFTVFGSERYQARADEKSWAALLGLLDEVL
ncbi:dienelactone hydrolase family protein [Halomonas denitrificans]|uniref:dienelactone hydrolase family protein n=1 Tax=Halomonas denitrificans TaxID=370769 RepID=UPI000D3362FA|nr:dienelactone hydrolase family protein [Halomonas denitrificans]